MNLITKTFYGDIIGIALGVSISIVLAILVIKFKLPKYMFCYIGILLLATLIFPAKEALEIHLDMKNQSYIEYIGHFECYHETIRLVDQDDLKLQTPRYGYDHGSFYGTVVYSERSKIVIDVVIDQDHSETFD
ncbi:MAG: hypothetical protein IJY16_08510 [Clostridia bacterium]|nr:hypothetical protein [Clostridia bacterium]